MESVGTRLYSLGKTRDSQGVSTGVLPVQAVEKLIRDCLSILARRPPGDPQFHPHWNRETDLSAQRASTEAGTFRQRMSSKAGRAILKRRRARPEAPLRVAGAARSRATPQPLSRSRDFDTVYRHGRSVSTRYLVLYRFDREDDEDGDVRLGIAIPKKIGSAVTRNRIKRRSARAGASSSPTCRPGRTTSCSFGHPSARPRRAAAPSGCASVSRKFSARHAREVRRDRRRLCLPLHAGCALPGDVQVPPSCSQYAIDALRQYGLVRRTILAGWRLLRCNPWSHGGVDKAEDQRLFR